MNVSLPLSPFGSQLAFASSEHLQNNRAVKKTEKALAILAKIRDLIDNVDCGFDDPEARKRVAGLVRILKMHASGFLPNATQQIYLNEQIHKLDEYKEDLFSARKPRFWRTHGECQADMVGRCIMVQGLIQRHATEYEETRATEVKPSRIEPSRH